MELFGIKKALQAIIDGKYVKMSSTDFKSHIFYLNKDKKNKDKPIIHEIKKNTGYNVIFYMTSYEFMEKFKENSFYEIEDNL